MSRNYGQVAAQYKDLTLRGTFKGVVKSVGVSGVERLLEQLKKYYKPDGKVLEIACGTGRVTFPAAKFIHYMIATDISQECIKEARALAEDQGVKNIDFQIMDARALTFPDNTFNLVFTHLPAVDLKFYISEVKRVLKSHGIFIISHSGAKHMTETGKVHRLYYLQKSIRLSQNAGFKILKVFEDKQKLWFDTAENRWNLVLMPYGNDPHISTMKANVEKHVHPWGYPLTLDKVTLVLKKAS